MKLEVFDSSEAVAERAAGILAEVLLDPKRAPMGLATGRTMVAVYQCLVPLLQQAGANALGHWRSFNLDEYVGLGPDDPRSFAAYMARYLGEPLAIPAARMQLPNGLAPNPHLEALRYRQQVQTHGLGLQLLGLGENGHVGFNEPPCDAFAPCRCVELSDATRQQNAAAFGGEAKAVPERAITLGLADILAAEEVLLVVTGANKSSVLRRVLQEPPQQLVPASWLQGHPNCLVLADRSAVCV
ncbi:glucosamine-6-phosphate deaminase [Synechococcus sp. UW140]|uniref:glucosamine-6-phosphate deaminase n=1 Tax=Synechococcus sp. UW140 TaxID=368503 RepID=UPI00313815A2